MRVIHIDPEKQTITKFDLLSGDELAEALGLENLEDIAQEAELSNGDLILVRDAPRAVAGFAWTFENHTIYGPAVIIGWMDDPGDFTDVTSTFDAIASAVKWEPM